MPLNQFFVEYLHGNFAVFGFPKTTESTDLTTDGTILQFQEREFKLW
jgi:hypothetical protein